MKNKGLLIVISGPSGVGKGTVCEALTQRDDLFISISATTRSPRKGEINGKNYYFITEEEFKKRIENSDFLEYAHVYGNYYGTPKSKVLEMLDDGKDVILEIDTQGALQVKKSYSDGIFIFIVPPSMKALRNRIVNRGSETKQSLEIRLKSAYNELKLLSQYDYAVTNDIVENAVSKIESIISAEKCSVKNFDTSMLQSEEE